VEVEDPVGWRVRAANQGRVTTEARDPRACKAGATGVEARLHPAGCAWLRATGQRSEVTSTTLRASEEARA
jgi:hypothetical protein